MLSRTEIHTQEQEGHKCSLEGVDESRTTVEVHHHGLEGVEPHLQTGRTHIHSLEGVDSKGGLEESGLQQSPHHRLKGLMHRYRLMHRDHRYSPTQHHRRAPTCTDNAQLHQQLEGERRQFRITSTHLEGGIAATVKMPNNLTNGEKLTHGKCCEESGRATNYVT